MAIVNRDLDSSQQVLNFGAVVPTATGLSGAVTGQNICFVPCAAQFVGGGIAAKGLSGSPNVSLWVSRFIAGTGHTNICIGASLVLNTFGVSGGQTFAAVTSGITAMQAGDVISLVNGAANTGADYVCVTLAIKALQDIKQSFGASV